MTRLNLVVLRVTDLERAVKFYRVIGLDFIKHTHGTGPEHYASEHDGAVFELYPSSTDRPVTAGVRVGFRVSDVDTCVSNLHQLLETKIQSTPKNSQWGRRAVVTDPDGHTVELVSDNLI